MAAEIEYTSFDLGLGLGDEDGEMPEPRELLLAPAPAVPAGDAAATAAAAGGAAADAGTAGAGGGSDDERFSDDDDFLAMASEPEPSTSSDGMALGKGTPSGAGAVMSKDGPPPWWREDASRAPLKAPMLRLHEEILWFADFVKPTPEEQERRRAAYERVEAVVKETFVSGRLEVFGSYATGMYLPTSDIDCVVLDSGVGTQADGVRALGRALSRGGLARKMELITKARVPIVKFVEALSGIQFDVSFDVANGPQAAHFVCRAMQELPPLRPLCVVIKLFLQQRELNEVYTGGIGSYALITMIIAYLQLHPSRRVAGGDATGVSMKPAAEGTPQHQRASRLEPSLGMLLVGFFQLYGSELNSEAVGVGCAGGGHFFSKQAAGMMNYQRPFLLAVQDPQDDTNDLGRSSYNYVRVKQAFEHASLLLVAPLPPRPAGFGASTFVDGDSILERILRRDFVLEERRGITGEDAGVGHELGALSTHNTPAAARTPRTPVEGVAARPPAGDGAARPPVSRIADAQPEEWEVMAITPGQGDDSDKTKGKKKGKRKDKGRGDTRHTPVAKADAAGLAAGGKLQSNPPMVVPTRKRDRDSGTEAADSSLSGKKKKKKKKKSKTKRPNQ